MSNLFNQPLLQPLRQRNFRLLWIGQLIAWSGDSIYQIGLLWLILEMTGSQSLAGYIAAVGYLPALLLGLFLGALVDAGDRRKYMMWADLLRAAVLLYIPVAFAGGWLSPWQLALAAFLISSGAALFNPARDSSVPLLVPHGSLISANALIQTTAHAALLMGPLLAGGILALTSLTGLFFADSLAYSLSFLTIFLLRLPSADTVKSAIKPFQAVAEGLKYTVQEKWAGQLVLLSALNNLFIMGPAIVGIPIIVKEVYKLGPEAFAAVVACHGVGMLIGAILLGSFGKNLPKGKVLLSAIIFDGVTFIPVFFAPDVYWLGGIFLFHSIGIPFIMVPRNSLIQEGIPSSLQGRFFSLINLTVVGMMALSAAMTGVACEAWGAPTVFFAIGVGGAACGLLGFLLKDLRTRR